MRDRQDVLDLAEAVGLKVWPSFVERAQCDKKEIYLNGGWRGGKSASAAFITLCDIVYKYLAEDDESLIWLVGPDYEQARPEYFYLSQWCAKLGMQVNASTAVQGSLRMELRAAGLPGVVSVVTKSASDPTSLGSFAPKKVVECEAGQISEEADMWVEGRTAEKNADIIRGGTFENDEGKAQFVHFEQRSAEADSHPSQRRQAFRLPTWENEYIYGSCLKMIGEDPALALWCPIDTPHGDAHSGLNHPMIRQLKERWRDRPRDWAKRFGGEPQGVQNPVYEWSLTDNLKDFTDNRYLKPMPRDLKWLRSAGGMDFGTVHPSAACVISMTREGDTWVRACPQDKSGRIDWIWQTQEAMSRVYGIPASMWGRDPMVKYTPSYVPGEAMSGSLFAREARVGICNSVAQSGHLFFDASNPEVVVLFSQIQRLHRKRQTNGQLQYVREDDDGPASWEDAMAMMHGQPVLQLPKRWTLPKKSKRYVNHQPARSVS